MLQKYYGFRKQDIELWEHFTTLSTKEDRMNFLASQKGRDLIVIQVESLQDFDRQGIRGPGDYSRANSLIRERAHSILIITICRSGRILPMLVQPTIQFTEAKRVIHMTCIRIIASGGCRYYSRKAGYSTVAMHGYEGGFWNRCEMYPSLGFDTFIIDCEGYEPTATHGWGILDEEFISSP